MSEVIRKIPERLIGVGLPSEIALPQTREILSQVSEVTRREIGYHRPRVYLSPDDPKHGLQHTGETVGLALIGARLARYNGYNVNYHIVGQIAGYHDSHHLGGEIPDFEHGENAALWIEENFLHFGDQRFTVASEIRDHVPDDKPEISDNLKVVKDADSLNRVRFNNMPWGLDPVYLRYKFSKDLLIPIALELHAETTKLVSEGFGDGFACAQQAMVNLQLAVDW
jgi:hypothetical protein